jgi:hypothetical protein
MTEMPYICSGTNAGPSSTTTEVCIYGISIKTKVNEKYTKSPPLILYINMAV